MSNLINAIVLPPLEKEGVDEPSFPTPEVLVSAEFESTGPLEVGDEIEVAFLGYNDIKCLSKGIGLSTNQLCLSCTTGNYSCLKYKPKFRNREELKA